MCAYYKRLTLYQRSTVMTQWVRSCSPTMLSISLVYVYVRRYGLHYNVSMMSFLQEVKELMNKYIHILSRWKASFHAKFQVHCAHGRHTYGLHYVLSGMIIIRFSRCKVVCLYTRLDKAHTISSSLVLGLVSFKRR